MSIALEVRAEDAVMVFRETAGPWDVGMAKELRPQSIRGMYSTQIIPCMYINVCIYLLIYVSEYNYVYMYIHIYTYIYTYINIYIDVPLNIYLHT
jgi:hypothetical protein